jgi:Ca2+/H+ antiporter, TMEM165/GDT1 family
MRRKWFFFAPLAIVGMLAFMAIGSVVVMALWNWLLPALFGLHQITFWQALGILVLCRLLFGGLGRHGGFRPNFRHRMRERWFERWERMNPEERERFRHGMRGRCGFDAVPNQSKTESTS